jgi:NADPH-dependent glutamate synthase beta subunit-like oxidoreductase/NAD(P)H-flavin reductase
MIPLPAPALSATLPNGTPFADLYTRDGLVRLDAAFCAFLTTVNSGVFNRLMAARAAPDSLSGKDESTLILDLAPYVDDWLGELFGITAQIQQQRQATDALAPLFATKRLFVQRVALKQYTTEQAATFDGQALRQQLAILMGQPFSELAYATAVEHWRTDESHHAASLDLAARYAAWAVHTPEGQQHNQHGVLFRIPKKLDFQNLVPVDTVTVDGVTLQHLPDQALRNRIGFGLTDEGATLAQALDQATYCIWCHNQERDSCSTGLKDRKTGTFQSSPLGVTLAGCPLEEKISEMNFARARGDVAGALAITVIDNPMCAGTGRRICNDCMKSCIYQKQEPVDIPQVETRTLRDVLALPWGFEIYSLLTRWNPLNIRRPLPKPASGYKALVVGVGPAGYTLAHHLLQEGHSVVAIDGLKIEPLPSALSGVDITGAPVPFDPVFDAASLEEDLDRRITSGFGGVAEYGITVRWDKNFLKIIRLLLERRRDFAMIGGVRFGGTVTVDSAFAMGFDHIALCMGAGRPTLIAMPNGLARGVRQASDFLMSLQLTGAAKADSVANLQLRLPVVVIGGGLTAIDTATEALAYYPRQVERFLVRYEQLTAVQGEAAVRAGWSPEDTAIAEEFLTHARALRREWQQPQPNIPRLLHQWGGATVVYRRRLVDAPCYTLNHEEVHKALEEGIRFAELLTPQAVAVDAFGHAAGLQCQPMAWSMPQDAATGSLTPTGTPVTLPARSILVAAGTKPNTVLAREDDTLTLDGSYFQAIDTDGTVVTPQRLAKPDQSQVLTHRTADGRFVSFFGDLHPSYAGNVVKAMASAKQGYPVVCAALRQRSPSPVTGEDLRSRCTTDWRAVVHAVHRLTPTIVEVVIKAPAAARAFQPGQFYRLQNFESVTVSRSGTRPAMAGHTMEGLALTGASVDREQGLLSTIVLEMGGSSNLCAQLQPGEPVILMGPTGAPTEIPGNETVLLAGGGLGNAVLFSIGQAMRQAGCRVLYFAGYKALRDRYKVADIEAAADVVVWCCDEAPGFVPSPARPQDRAFVGNIVAAMAAYGRGELEPHGIDSPAHAPAYTVGLPLAQVDRIIAIGSDRMMAAVAAARHGVLRDRLNPRHVAVGSINSPMQCMLKEICAQCLQLHRDPVTGTEIVVFSCFNQDQDLDRVDFASLRQRLGQNSVAENLTRQWLAR